MRTAPGQMTMEELLALPSAFGIKLLARALGLGQSKVYEYAAAGEVPGGDGYPPIPIRQYGQEYRATRPDTFRHLGLDPHLVRAPEVEAS